MKKYTPILVLFIVFSFSCENIETGSASLQANLNEFFYRSSSTVAEKHQDRSYTITGSSNNQVLKLHIEAPQAGEYAVGGGSPNWATYEDENGNVYTTIPNGEGAITVTAWDTSFKTLSGNFQLKMMIPGIDTITVSNGIFYEVPYGFGTTENTNQSAGNVIAKVDGVSFSPISVNATETGNNIIIVAVSSNYTITLTFPNDVATGNYNIPSSEITATISDGTTSEAALNGTAIVVEHDTSFKVIRGTFAFTTDTHQVTVGQFNVGY